MASSIEELMAALAKQSNSFAAPKKSAPIKYKHSSYKKLNLTPYNFSAKDFSSLVDKKDSKKSSSFLGTLGDILSGTLGQPSGAITNTLYNTIKHATSDKESTAEKIMHLLPTSLLAETVTQGLKNGGKEQWKDWTDGKFSAGDIPLVGALHGMDKGWKRGEDILHDEAGVDNRWGKIGGGIGIDIALDPLTYLTGGLSAATKLGKAAELAKVAELSKGLGIGGKFKNADKFLETATNAMKTGMIKKYPNVSEHIIDKTVSKKIGELAEQIKTARNTTYNSHVNDWGFAVPFTNKFGKVGTYGSKNLLHNSEAMVDPSLVKNLISHSALGKDTSKLLEGAIKARYGVDDATQLSKTMYDDLHGLLTPIIDRIQNGKSLPDVKVTQEVGHGTFHADDFEKLMDKFVKDNVPWKDVQKQIQEIMTQTNIGKHSGNLRSSHGADLAKMVEDYWMSKPAKNFSKVANERKAESMKWAERLLRDSDTTKGVDTHVDAIYPHGSPEANAAKDANVFSKQFNKMVDKPYNEMGNFKSNFEHILDKHNPFDARTLATGDKFVNSMGDHIADANSQRVGETARYTKALDDVESFIKKQQLDETGKKQLMEHAIYILEKHAPDELGGSNWVPSRAAQKLADKLRPVIDQVGSEEMKAGVLDGLRKNYFPHVVNKDESAWKEIEEFNKRHPELSSLKGVSSKSKFNSERKSFQTLAQRDNYIAKIEKAISKATDKNEIESLRSQQERVAKMFDTDVVSALTRRVKEGVRAKAMKEMQTKLSKYGMMKTIEKGSKETPPTGLEKLDPAEAKRLGLGEGDHYVHPEVLKGMKRVDEIFTADGMKKWQRHLTAFADAWRPLVTYYKLSHYRNNIIGNVINNMAAGVKAADYKVARKLVMGYKSGKLNESQMKIIEAAFKHNVISGGFLYDAHATFEHAKPNTLEKIGKALGQNQAIKKVRHHLGETPDDISRMANFVNGINKWGNTERAAKQVRTYLFNYNELTNADRQMRVLVPFWNWTKRNVPLQMKLLMENPKFAMNIERFKEMFNKDEKGQDWQKESGVKVPLTNYYTTLPSPTNDLSQLVHPVQFAGSMNPLPKSIIELMTNRKLFTGAPISYGSNNVQAKDLPAYAASNSGILGDLYKLLDGQRTPTEALINSGNPITAIK